MDFCPHCGAKSEIYHGFYNVERKGLHKLSNSTWLYQCYNCGYKLSIKPLKHYNPKDLKY